MTKILHCYTIERNSLTTDQYNKILNHLSFVYYTLITEGKEFFPENGSIITEFGILNYDNAWCVTVSDDGASLYAITEDDMFDFGYFLEFIGVDENNFSYGQKYV